MSKLKVVFTDSGLGGFTIMTEFLKLVNLHKIPVDATFFNAQHSRVGYKKMDSKTQVAIFNRVLISIEEKFKPDIIAIACNTLSVVYLKTDFYKKSSTKVLDIIKTGKSLIKQAKSNTIIELAMPTTIDSGIYIDKEKVRIPVSSDITLPDAIERGDQSKISQILEQIFKDVKAKMIYQDYNKQNVDLFLGCTHFPIIKDQFLTTADKSGIKIRNLLNPNIEFSQLVLEEVINKQDRPEEKDRDKSQNKISVISRVKFKENEIKNISELIKIESLETAKALKNYTYDSALF